VDFYVRELGDPNTEYINLNAQQRALDDAEGLQLGKRVVVAAEDLRCEGVGRRKAASRTWVVALDQATYLDTPESE
jgi:hypothetical protein